MMWRRAAIGLLLGLLVLGCSKHETKTVRVPGGTFTAGSARLSTRDNPERQVTVKSFVIDRYEVTNAQYDACVRAGTCTVRPPLPAALGAPQQPAVMVTWKQAARYCAWRGRRLPTENEWERAARGAANSLYPWGERFAPASNGGHAEACVVEGRTYRFSSPAGCYPRDASDFGVHDMSGNVAEWVADAYSPVPHSPTAQGEPGLRVVKGGYYYAEPDQLSGAWREPAPENNPGHRIGFRCAADP